MVIVIIVGLLAAFLAGFFCAVKSVQMGLRWQIQTANKQEPVLKSPIAPVVDSVRQAKADQINKYSREQMQEWMFGREVE